MMSRSRSSTRRSQSGGVTVARFVGDRIAELRQFWYEVELLEGLGLLAVE
jgi:hypothetical protein